MTVESKAVPHWYAKIDPETVIATGATYEECSANARPFWTDFGKPKGSTAPYYITTIGPGAVP